MTAVESPGAVPSAPPQAAPPQPPSQSPPPSTPPRQLSSAIVFGGLLVTVGVVLLLAQLGLITSAWPTVPTLLLIGLGVVIIIEGARGVWHVGLIVTGVTLAIILAASSAASRAATVVDGIGDGAGDQAYIPTEVSDVADGYDLGAGDLSLDLTELQLPPGATPVRADVGIGDLVVRVPAETAVTVEANVGTGEVDVFDEVHSGMGVENNYTSPGYDTAGRKLELDLDVGIGRIEVTH